MIQYLPLTCCWVTLAECVVIDGRLAVDAYLCTGLLPLPQRHIITAITPGPLTFYRWTDLLWNYWHSWIDYSPIDWTLCVPVESKYWLIMATWNTKLPQNWSPDWSCGMLIYCGPGDIDVYVYLGNYTTCLSSVYVVHTAEHVTVWASGLFNMM